MESRVYLRGFESSDYKTTLKWRQDEEISSMVGGQKYFVTSDMEKKWAETASMDNTRSIRLMVCLEDMEEPIGMVTLTDINYVNRTAHSNILLGNKDSWGKGYGTKALNLLLAYAFEELGLNRIEALILDSNIGSIKLHKKCGYREEGVKRNSIYKNGHYHNQILVSLLKEESKWGGVIVLIINNIKRDAA